MGTPAIEITGLSVTLGPERTQVLRDITLEVRSHEILALVGRSGTGKSTLINVMSGLLPAENDQVLFGEGQHGRVRTTTVFQAPRLFPWLTVLDNVALGMSYRAHPEFSRKRSVRRAHATRVLDSLGIGEFAHRRPYELSGGQQQRVGIARAVAGRPDVLLLDEPFSALDVATRTSLQEWLMRHRDELAPTIVLVTHDLSEALYMADRIALLTNESGDLPVWESDVRDRGHLAHSSVRAEIERCFFEIATG